MINNFIKIITQNAEINRIQEQISRIFEQVLNLPLLNGVFISATLSAGTNTAINHGLTRIPLGWIIVDKGSAGDIWRTSWDNRTITLNNNSATTITVKLFIF